MKLKLATISRFRSHSGQNKAITLTRNKLIRIKIKKLMKLVCWRFINHSDNKFQKIQYCSLTVQINKRYPRTKKFWRIVRIALKYKIIIKLIPIDQSRRLKRLNIHPIMIFIITLSMTLKIVTMKKIKITMIIWKSLIMKMINILTTDSLLLS